MMTGWVGGLGRSPGPMSLGMPWTVPLAVGFRASANRQLNSGRTGRPSNRTRQPIASPMESPVSNASHRFDNDLRYRAGTHAMQRQLTPGYVLAPIRSALGGIALDPCTEPDNPTGATRFYTVDDDGLAQPWDYPTIYVNPPYGKAREPWVEACIAAAAAGSRVALLIPSHTDTRVFHRIFDTADAVCFIKGRVKFGVLRNNRRQEAASHPSAVVGWNVDLSPLSVIGRVVPLAVPALQAR